MVFKQLNYNYLYCITADTLLDDMIQRSVSILIHLNIMYIKHIHHELYQFRNDTL